MYVDAYNKENETISDLTEYEQKTCWSRYLLLSIHSQSWEIMGYNKKWESTYLSIHIYNFPICRKYIRHNHNPIKLSLSWERRATERESVCLFLVGREEQAFLPLQLKKTAKWESVAHRLPFCEGKLVLSSEKNTGLKKSYGEKSIFHKISEKIVNN